MRFFTTAVCAITALAGFVLGQENPLIKPDNTEALVAGKTFTITWTPTTTGPITLTLKNGISSDLKTVTTIVSGAPNTGSYTWSIPSTLARGTDYAIQIADAANNLNYTPQFTINSDATAPASSSSASSSSAATPTTKTSSPTVPTTLTTSTVSKVPSPVFTPFGGLNITVGGNGTAPTGTKNLPTVVVANEARGNAANVVAVMAVAVMAVGMFIN